MAIPSEYRFNNSVKTMYMSGCSIKEIALCKEKTVEEIHEIIVQLGLIQIVKTRSSGILGSKTEPYYKSEEEMMNPPVYKYEELSKKEKEFYESRTDK
jgi:hypothetical protein